MAEEQVRVGPWGRPLKKPEERRITATVSLYGPQLEKLKRAAKARGTTPSEVMRCLIEQMPPNGPTGIRRDG